jgi:predicted nucleic acid-binding protein
VGGAEVIVSGDQDLCTLERVGGIASLTAAQFLEVLEQAP